VTVGQWLRHWCEVRIRLRENTRRSYRGLIEHYLIPHLGRIPLAELNYRDVKRMLVALMKLPPGDGHLHCWIARSSWEVVCDAGQDAEVLRGVQARRGRVGPLFGQDGQRGSPVTWG
jgi:hypothetical protein